MLSISSGHDTRYLTDAVAAGREGYYVSAVDAGEPPGIWYGAGAEALGLRGQVDAEIMQAVYSRLLDPRDPAAHDPARRDEAATLGAAHRRYRSAEELYAAALEQSPDAGPEARARMRAAAERSARQAVAFYDCTFSAPKSVTVLGVAVERAENEARAAGDEVAAEAWAAHRRAVEDAVLAGARASVDYLAQQAGFARVGHHGGAGGRWVDAHGWVVAQFLQHDSRDRDPQLHVHQAVLNRVQCPDGTWRALDGKALHLHRGAAGAVGERVMEEHLARTLGVRFAIRPDGRAREIVGVDPELMELFSSRRRAIGPKTAELVERFRAQFGREPTAVERKGLAQQATLWTRAAKSHDGETTEARLARWEAQTRQVVAGGLRQVAEAALRPAPDVGPARWDERDVVERALAELAEDHQTWTRPRLIRAISDALPAQLGVDPEQIVPLLEGLADRAVRDAVRVDPERATDLLPADLLTEDGRDARVRPGEERFTTADQLLAERLLREAAIERVDARCSVADADEVVDLVARAGLRLGEDQAAVVRGVLSSGAQVQVVAAPAGTGKSVVVGAVAEGWRRHGGRVRGLTPSQVAADVLTAEGVDSLNLAAWRGRLRSGRETVTAGDLLVVDEAGMATTGDLLEVTERARAAGATVLLVGDPRQLGAVGPGGALADLAERAQRYELVEVRRFTDAWEREASLRLRDGDLEALADYDKHGRLLDAGTLEQAEQRAARAWLADTVDGRESLLLVGSNESAARISAELRAQLVRLGRVAEHGVLLGRDGNTAGVGDLVQARRNAWDLEARPVNRATYRVLEVMDDGGLRVEPTGGGGPVVLPASYVCEDLTLAYASTVHAAQGRTVDTAHAVLGGGMDVVAAYVAMTRGRLRSTAHVVTARTPEDSPIGEASTVEPRTARAVLADALEQTERERTALGEQEHAELTARSVLTNLEALSARVAEATAGRLGRILDGMLVDGLLTEAQREQLAIDSSTASLERLLRTIELAGHNPARVLRDAAASHSLVGSRSVAQVLSHRIRTSGRDLTPRIAQAADLVPTIGVRSDYRALLREHAELIDTRRHELGAEMAAAPPAWLLDALGPVPEDAVERIEWERKAGWAAAAREATGHDADDRPLGVAPAGVAEKHALWRTAHHELDLPEAGAEEALLSDGGLRRRVEAARREEAWAPRYVADELAATEERAQARHDDAVLWAAHADRLDDPAEAEQLRAAAAEAREEAERLTAQVDQLRAADDARAAWLAETAITRDLAERAKAELAARGVDVDDAEGRVTAEEWLAAHAEAEAEDELHREVTEADVPTREAYPLARSIDGPTQLAETAVPDVRDTAVVDESQHADTGRRVPSLQETATAVERARVALLEIRAREELVEPDEQPVYETDVRDEPDDAHAAEDDALVDELS